MKEKLNEFLETYARGRYAGSRLQTTPEINFLILDEHVKATTRQIAILESKVSEIACAPVTVTQYSDHLRETFMTALNSILHEAIGLSIEGAHFELVAKEKARVFLAVNSEHSHLTAATRIRVSEIALSIGRPLGIENVELEITGHGHSAINDALVIREVLKVAPIDAAGLAIVLSASETIQRTFSETETGVMLDRLRRKGLLIWQPSGKYAPAQKALYLYSSSKSRRSSDIERALALGRKRW
jgi:hypothetical protein